MKPAPILNPAFKWIPAASHDADSTAFRARQQQRMRDAQTAAKSANANIKPIKGRKQA